MSSVTAHLNKLREERMAREKARIDKLREMNLKKYSTAEPPSSAKSVSQASSMTINRAEPKKSVTNAPKSNVAFNGSKRPITAPNTNRKSIFETNVTANVKTSVSTANKSKEITGLKKAPSSVTATAVNRRQSHVTGARSISATLAKEKGTVNLDQLKKPFNTEVKTINPVKKIDIKPKMPVNVERKSTNFKSFNDSRMTNNPKIVRKSFAPPTITRKDNVRKSMVPQQRTNNSLQNGTANSNRMSVFERLYQPKMVHKKEISETEKLQTDPNYLKKVIKNSGLLLNKRHTVFEQKQQKEKDVHVRRSISAVHLKRVNKNELTNCIHKWSSIGEKLDKVHFKDEDENLKGDKIVSAVKSERKKVTFQTPYNFNTPRPEELQSRLQNWLQKRGKSIDSYHHLQCFGIHHLARKEIKPLNLETSRFEDFDDEDKENQPLESDTDNESYEDNMNNRNTEELKLKDSDKWRRVSCISESVDFNETTNTTMTSAEMHHEDDLLFGALNDLTELLKEGFDWEQCARWLRSIRDRFPSARQTASYWECRAALEERRGDLTASVHCWQEAAAKGTQHSVVEANLDQLLDKFMQLKISPNSGRKKQPDPKLVDVKNVFKSTLIRFAVQQAKLRQSQEAKYTVTPVRRSGRISSHWSAKKTPVQGNLSAKIDRSARRTPLQVCTTVKQAGLLGLGLPLEFVPNETLCDTP